MDFSYSDQQRDVQNLAREIFTDKASPERQDEVEKAGERFDKALWMQLAQSGLLGTAIEESYGGINFGFTELCLLVEEAGRSTAPVPLIPVLVSAALPLQRFGSDEQKQRLLPGVVSGNIMLTAALMESQNENPAKPLLTRAYAGENVYRLSGRKMCVPFADKAERVLLSAQTDEGVGVFLLDPKAPGVELIALKTTSHEPQFELILNDVTVASADRIDGCSDSEADTGGAQIMQWISERTIAAYCAMQVGVSDKAMRITAAYTSERKQFDVPIATFQAVGHRAANCYIDVECLQLVTQQAISLLDNDHAATSEVQIAKIWAGDCGHRVSYAAQHLHGGVGIDKEYPLWRYCVWSRHIEMILGSSSAQLAALGERIAAGQAFVD